MIKHLLRAVFSCLALLNLDGSALAAPAPLTITVYGRTGNIGLRIVQEALSRGHQVTVVARNPATLAINAPGLAVAKGDVTDTAQVTKQLADQDLVISAIGVGRDDQGNDLLMRAAQSLVTAIRSLGDKAQDAAGNSSISMEDYAVAMIDEAEKPAHTRQRFTIGY